MIDPTWGWLPVAVDPWIGQPLTVTSARPPIAGAFDWFGCA